MSHHLFEKHRQTLDNALDAIRTRAYWSAYPEVPSEKIYGEGARKAGQEAYQSRLNQSFAIDQPGEGTVGEETSPYGFPLGITYPRPNLDTLIAAASVAQDGWKRADAETRIGIMLEALHRLNQHSFELAFAVMHTTGQGFMMAFQAGGPHAQDRGLEAVAYAHLAMTQTPATTQWTKRVGKEETVTLQKTFRILPRGVAAVIGCSTFPTWNGYPGLFASLATGNAVIVKPHPGAILPLAITVEIIRDVLKEEGFDPNIITLAADTAEAPIAQELVTNPAVKIIDYTGGSDFGNWIEQHAQQAEVYTEKAGVNSIIIDSADDLRAMTGNIGFTLCLYSGQMCTTSQNIFIPATGCAIGGEQKSFDEIAAGIVKAVDWLLSDAARGAEILGAIQNERTMQRIDEAKESAAKAGGTILRESTPVANEHFPEARVRSPLIIQVEHDQVDQYGHEMFGPIVYIVRTKDTNQSIELASKIAREQGAITASVYSQDSNVLEKAEQAMAEEAGVPLSCNLTGSIWVNQSAAFSDFHVSGANPAGNATLCDLAYVANRFRIVQSRIPVPTPEPVSA